MDGIKKSKSNRHGSRQAGAQPISRRKFIGMVGVGAAAVLATPAWAWFELPAEDLERWKKSLGERGASRIYSSDKHTDARMHLGGIGTGNFEIGADGQLTTWQLFNTLRDGEAPFYFAVKAGETARLLQTAGGPDWPRVKHIAMTGDYPVATLRYEDDDLPVQLEMEAFTPFSPLETDESSLPLAIFNFRAKNTTQQPQKISLAAMMTNPIGYAAIGKIEDNSHPSLGHNANEAFREGGASGLVLRAKSGAEPSLDKPVDIFMMEDSFVVPPDPGIDNKNFAATNPRDLAIPPLDRPQGLRVLRLNSKEFAPESLPKPSQTLIWLEEARAEMPDSVLSNIEKAVTRGATLLFSGDTMPLLAAYGAVSRGQPIANAASRPDTVFEDFENGYGKWTVSGNAFGTEPAHGTLPNQQPVSGFLGAGLVNSYVNGDDATGRLTSQSFIIDRNFIHFLVGGGHYPATQIRLLIDGKIVRATSGRDNERLESAAWNVAEYLGRMAHLEIVDEQKGGWGHINIDQIVFSDSPANGAVLQILERLLPMRFHEARTSAGGLTFPDATLLADAKRTSTDGGLEQFERPVGEGRVIVLGRRLLDPAQTCSARIRKKVYQQLCAQVGAAYTMTDGQSAKEPGFGTLALAVLGNNATALTSFENWADAWHRFEQDGGFSAIEVGASSDPTSPGRTTNAALATTIEIPAGEEVEIPFLLTWHYPNKYNAAGESIGCYYATQWRDASDVMRHAVQRYDALNDKTALFRRTLYDSTLPYWLLDCLTANAAIARHGGVVFRIANGDVYGWEGSNGSCAPTCTHVWGYEQSFAHLFPALEKEMRRIDFTHQQRADGGINNRTQVPSPPHPSGEMPFTDGHCSCILKAYREAMNSPDDSFLREYWPRVKRAVEYLIQRDKAGGNGMPAGILQDDQWNTYDEALHGVTTFISGYYLAALRAGEEWARRMGDSESSERYRAIFKSGQARLMELCWNGEYFQQHLPDYLQRKGEAGPGCMADQLIGQWWAHQLDLGYILPEDNVKSALRAIFKYNFKSDLTGWKHWPRPFAGDRDKGLIVCTWPKGGRPANVLLYSDEVWTGMEYQVAAHMVFEGFVEEGFAIAKGARERYDGAPRSPIQRNPWCEIECGGHYTRAMSSWSLLLALSGFHYDGPSRAVSFAPRYKPDNFKSFFTTAEAWGSLEQISHGGKKIARIGVASGSLKLASLELAPQIAGSFSAKTTLNRNMVFAQVQQTESRVRLDFGKPGIAIKAGENLEITLTPKPT